MDSWNRCQRSSLVISVVPVCCSEQSSRYDTLSSFNFLIACTFFLLILTCYNYDASLGFG